MVVSLPSADMRHLARNGALLSFLHFTIPPTPVAKDLGVFLDQSLSYDEQIRKTRCQLFEHQISKGQISERSFRDINTVLSLLFPH